MAWDDVEPSEPAKPSSMPAGGKGGQGKDKRASPQQPPVLNSGYANVAASIAAADDEAAQSQQLYELLVRRDRKPSAKEKRPEKPLSATKREKPQSATKRAAVA